MNVRGRWWVLSVLLSTCAEPDPAGEEGSSDCASLDASACEAEENSHCAWFTVWRADPDTCELDVLAPRCAEATSVGPGCAGNEAPGCGGEAAWVVQTEAGNEFWSAPGACWLQPVDAAGACEQSDAGEAFEGCACGCAT